MYYTAAIAVVTVANALAVILVIIANGIAPAYLKSGVAVVGGTEYCRCRFDG